jgi:hypothetical protein
MNRCGDGGRRETCIYECYRVGFDQSQAAWCRLMRALLLPRKRTGPGGANVGAIGAIANSGLSIGAHDTGNPHACAQPDDAIVDSLKSARVSETESAIPDVAARGPEPSVPIGLTPMSMSGGVGGYDEDWLQELLFAHPQLIPMDRIEAGAGEVVPLCRELPIARTGGVVFLDMLGVTRSGRLVLIECKLWRNPQARREVVAQVIEYAGLMRGWSYGDLTARLKQRCGWTGANPIFDHARKFWPDLDEASFVDRISRSLDNSDFHLVIAGDGIRSDVQVLARQINEAGSKARLSLVEIQIWQAMSGETVILPFVPIKTEVIEQRVVVATENGRQLQVQEVRIDDPNAGRGSGRERAAEDQPGEKTVGPERAASNERMRQFWTRFIETARFDHPEQTKPSHGGPNWVKVALTDGYRLSAYRQSNQETMGVYMPLSLDKDPGLIAVFEADLDGMRQESSLDLQIVPRDGDPSGRDLSVYTSYKGLSDDEQLAWLIKTTNSMVTLLRPKLSAWKRKAQEAELEGADA